MRSKKNRKINANKEVIEKKSIEYTTEQLIELGKKLNVMKLAKPLYDDCTDNKNEKNKKDDKWFLKEGMKYEWRKRNSILATYKQA